MAIALSESRFYRDESKGRRTWTLSEPISQLQPNSFLFQIIAKI